MVYWKPQSYRKMTHFSFFSKKCFFYWGTFFSALEQSREEHFFLFDSCWKTEEIDMGVFQSFDPKRRYWFFTAIFLEFFFICHLGMHIKTRRSKICEKAQRQSFHLSVFYQLKLFWELLRVGDTLKIFPNWPCFFISPDFFPPETKTLIGWKFGDNPS